MNIELLSLRVSMKTKTHLMLSLRVLQSEEEGVVGGEGGAGQVQGAGVAVVAHKGRGTQTQQPMHDRRHGTWAHAIRSRGMWLVRG